MSGRYRRRNNFSWRSSRFGGRRSFRGNVRSLRTRARGNMRAANQQNDTSDVVINLMTKLKSGVTGWADFAQNAITKEYYTGVAAVNIYDLLRKSEFFDSYSKMYDQFRITSIKVKITPVLWNTYNQFNLPNASGFIKTAGTVNDTPTTGVGIVNTGLAFEPDDQYAQTGADATDYPDNVQSLDNPPITKDTAGVRHYIKASDSEYIYPQALTVITAWDRTGLDGTQFFQKKVGGVGQNEYYTNIGDNITTYSSAKSQQLVAGATFNCTRYLYPSSQQEKSLYLATNELKPQFEYNANANYNALQRVDGVLEADIKPEIITNLWSSPSCPFKPTLMLGILSVEKLQLGHVQDSIDVQGGMAVDNAYTTKKINSVTFNLEFDIGVTFRGLRKSQVV